MSKKRTMILALTLLVLAVLVLFLLGGIRASIGRFAWYRFHASAVAEMLDPRDAAMDFDIGNYYFGGDHYDIREAEIYFTKTIADDGAFPQAHYQLARVYFLNGKFYSALREVNREIALYPDFNKSYYIKGLVLGYAGDLPGAVEGFKEFIARDDFNWAGWNDLSWAYFREGDYVDARNAAREGLLRAEGNPWLLNSLGVALMNLGDDVVARAAFSQALDHLNAMTPEDWGRSYPGNSPTIYGDGLSQMKASVAYNLALVAKTAHVDKGI